MTAPAQAADEVEQPAIGDLEIVYRDPKSLAAYARNSRTHTDDQIEKLKASILEYGFTNPILLKDDGKTIGAGHARCRAALALNLASVPTITLPGLSTTQWRSYVIADNQLAITGSGWDFENLRLELDDLMAEGFGVDLLGFSADEFAAIMNPVSESEADPDAEIEPPAAPVSVLGDVWILGNHRIACGSSTDRSDVDRALAGRKIELVCSDPPYGISVVKGGNIGGAKPFGKGHGPAKNAIIQPGSYMPIIGDDTIDTAVEHYKLMVEMGARAIVLWGGNYFAHKLPPSRCWLVWDKENTGSFADAELAWTNQDKVVKVLRHQWSGLIKASERGQRRVHPTQKPVALAEWVVEQIAPKCRLLFDGFLGSGWTLIAAERLGIPFVGMELSPAYVDVAVIRWQNFASGEATLESTGQTFAEVAAERAV